MDDQAHPGQPLVAHLMGVADKARRSAEAFGGAEQARLAALLHDLGKAEDEFQKRIRGEKGKQQAHAHHGAALVLEHTERGGPIWPVAFAINGHHAGLHNRADVDKRRSECRKARKAEQRLAGDEHWRGQEWPIGTLGEYLPGWLRDLPFDTRFESEGWLALDLYVRFLFSALVDADRLDTEENDEQTKGLEPGERRRGWNAFDADGLLSKLEAYIAKVSEENRDKTSKDVARVRNEVGAACRQQARGAHGIHTLTVPTGGGKTLASMLFALEHAKHHREIRRVIVVIPYLSIIQQSAEVYGKAFGENWVLEHHSQASDPEPSKRPPSDGTNGYNHEQSLRQLAAENWDAPIIVTTSVQFFDSLFSRRPADARKLHSIAESVIIFDECQTFPPRLMQPILNVLGELADPQRPYGCTLVFCTATQPALARTDELPCGLAEPTEINQKAKDHFKVLRRTTYPELEAQTTVPTKNWDDIAEELLAAPDRQGLAVVNTRRHARDLLDAVTGKLGQNSSSAKAVFHLSTWMTPAHRMEVLDEVRKRVSSADKQPCLLISTQCIEAGVDVDFPAVWRAFGPYDSIVQAAGRCNRNGRLPPDKAVVHVFRPQDETSPGGIYETATTQTDLLCKLKLANPHAPESFQHYFRLLYQLSVPDDCEIQRHRGQLHFAEVNDLFRFIDDQSFPVLVLDGVADGEHYDTESRARYDEAMKRRFFLAEDWRTIQGDIVNLPRYQMDYLVGKGLIEDSFLEDGSLYVLSGDEAYHGGLNGFGINFSPDYSERSLV